MAILRRCPGKACEDKALHGDGDPSMILDADVVYQQERRRTCTCPGSARHCDSQTEHTSTYLCAHPSAYQVRGEVRESSFVKLEFGPVNVFGPPALTYRLGTNHDAGGSSLGLPCRGDFFVAATG